MPSSLNPCYRFSECFNGFRRHPSKPRFASDPADMAPATSPKKRNLIVDTDIFSDVDDAGALLLAAMLNREQIDLKAVMVNHQSAWGALAVLSMLAYYGRPETKVGVKATFERETFREDWWDPKNRKANLDKKDALLFWDNLNYKKGEYASKIAYQYRTYIHEWFEKGDGPEDANNPGKASQNFHARGPEDEDDRFFYKVSKRTKDAASLYAEVLRNLGEDEEDKVTIVSIGFLNNLSSLLKLPDGLDLIQKHVKELIIMGGSYPTHDESKPPPWNWWKLNDKAVMDSAKDVVSKWPGKITFVGNEVGRPVLTGRTLMDEIPLRGYSGPEPWAIRTGDPVRQANICYTGYEDHSTWDPITVMYAIAGAEGSVTVGPEPRSEAARQGRQQRVYKVCGVKEGDGSLLRLSERGVNTLDNGCRNTFTAHPNGQHCYLILNQEADPVADAVSDMLIDGATKAAEWYQDMWEQDAVEWSKGLFKEGHEVPWVPSGQKTKNPRLGLPERRNVPLIGRLVAPARVGSWAVSHLGAQNMPRVNRVDSAPSHT